MELPRAVVIIGLAHRLTQTTWAAKLSANKKKIHRAGRGYRRTASQRYRYHTKLSEARRSHQYKLYDYRYSRLQARHAHRHTVRVRLRVRVLAIKIRRKKILVLALVLVLCGNKRSTKDTNISRVRNIKIVKQRLALFLDLDRLRLTTAEGSGVWGPGGMGVAWCLVALASSCPPAFACGHFGGNFSVLASSHSFCSLALFLSLSAS